MLKKFFSYYKPYKPLFCLDFFCAVIAGILELSFPFFVRYVIDEIIPHHHFSVIILIALGLLAFYLLNTLFKYIVVYYGHMLGVYIENDMRRELFAHLQNQSFSYFDHTKTGTLMTRLTSDLFYISELAHHGPEDLFVTVMTLVSAFFLMYGMHPVLAMLTVIMVPVIAVISAFYNKKMEKNNHAVYDSLAEFNVGIENTLSGIRVVKAFANEEYEKQRFETLLDIYKHAKQSFYQTMGNSSAFNYLFMRLINLFALFFGAYFTIHDGLTPGILAGFILLTNVLVRPIELINIMIETYPKGFAGFRRLQTELACQAEIVDAPHAKEVNDLAGDIEYRQVCFRYNVDQDVLNNMSLHIKKGEKVAFVGPSGAGKSTLCHLLPRFYDVSSGDILIDNISIKDITLASLRQQIGIVQQDVFLFGGTIKENILYGRLKATEEELYDVIEQAHLSEFIQTLPEGIHTQIGQRGIRLSGGQKQRLAIARILLKNPNILILDEATSALDTQTERIIQEAFDVLSKGRTTLIIAHRLATIQHVDRIIFLTKEGIVEDGSHAELMAKKGHYYTLYQAQFR